jgi:hypothetical protein
MRKQGTHTEFCLGNLEGGKININLRRVVREEMNGVEMFQSTLNWQAFIIMAMNHPVP